MATELGLERKALANFSSEKRKAASARERSSVSSSKREVDGAQGGAARPRHAFDLDLGGADVGGDGLPLDLGRGRGGTQAEDGLGELGVLQRLAIEHGHPDRALAGEGNPHPHVALHFGHPERGSHRELLPGAGGMAGAAPLDHLPAGQLVQRVDEAGEGAGAHGDGQRPGQAAAGEGLGRKHAR